MNNKGVKATASLAVGDDFRLELPKLFVFGRSNPADGAVYDVAREAKFNIGINCLEYILESTNNPRTFCKLMRKSTA